MCLTGESSVRSMVIIIIVMMVIGRRRRLGRRVGRSAAKESSFCATACRVRFLMADGSSRTCAFPDVVTELAGSFSHPNSGS
jgi:hypothetical protein